MTRLDQDAIDTYYCYDAPKDVQIRHRKGKER